MRLGRIILIVIVLLLVGGGAAAGFWFRDPLKKMVGLGGEAPVAEAPPKKVLKPEDFSYLDLPDIRITLNTRGTAANRIVKLAVSLQFEDEADQAQVQAFIPRVIDVFQVYVRQLSVEDVAGVQQMRRLRGELLTRVNAAVKPAHVDDVLFREVLVQ
jgi:flagellar FliL protein